MNFKKGAGIALIVLEAALLVGVGFLIAGI